MTKSLITILTIALAGCCSPDLRTPPATGTPADAMLTADPSAVTTATLSAVAASMGAHYWTRAQWEGVTLEPYRRDPTQVDADSFGKGGDSALFTGFALAAHALQAHTTGNPAALDHALTNLRGLWYVTHAAGPGVIARVAFPTAEASRFRYPESWSSNDQRFVGTVPSVPGPPLPAPFSNPFGETTFYTRGTKDQLTGIVFGLSVAWVMLPEGREAIRQTTADLATHLEAHGWKIRDENGANDTNADEVDGLLRLAFLALWRRTSDDPSVKARYLDEFQAGGIGDWFNGFTNYTQYYAHNLRSARAFGIWMLEDDAGRQAEMADYFHDRVWAYVSGHQNAWFAVIRAALTGGHERAEASAIALRSLASLSLRTLRRWTSPYGGQDHAPSLVAHLFGCADAWVLPPHQRAGTNYWLWQKDPWSTGSSAPNAAAPPHGDGTGLSFLLPYWLARATGLW